MSGFKPYPAYKDSGVEWLGEVPEHWATFSLKRSVDGCVNGLWGDEPDGESDLAVIRVADFDRSTCRVGLDKLTYRSITQRERASRLLQSGDLLIEKSGGGEKTLVGCVVLFEHEFQAITSNFVARMRPLPSFDSGFLCYAFDSLYQGKVNYPAIKQTTGIQNLDSESYLQERFCFPTLAEQTQIARFLDHETARIDALIEEQQRLIELLKEKRQAVISHAVTKGLDPTVPMKDSGVEWLGEVPDHWVMGSLKNMALIRNGKDYKEVESSDGEYPVIGSGGQFTTATHYLYEGESVLLGRKGTIDKPLYINGRFWTVDTMFYTEISRETCAKFFYYCSLTIPFNYYSTSTALPSMTQADLLNHPTAIPSKLEQTQIARFLDHETARIDALIEEANSGVCLLQERRSALISAAVTGKIDVRNWQPPAGQYPAGDTQNRTEPEVA